MKGHSIMCEENKRFENVYDEIQRGIIDIKNKEFNSVSEKYYAIATIEKIIEFLEEYTIINYGDINKLNDLIWTGDVDGLKNNSRQKVAHEPQKTMVANSNIFVRFLPEEDQNEILLTVRTRMEKEGYDEKTIKDSVENVHDDRLWVADEYVDIYEYIDRYNSHMV